MTVTPGLWDWTLKYVIIRASLIAYWKYIQDRLQRVIGSLVCAKATMTCRCVVWEHCCGNLSLSASMAAHNRQQMLWQKHLVYQVSVPIPTSKPGLCTGHRETKAHKIKNAFPLSILFRWITGLLFKCKDIMSLSLFPTVNSHWHCLTIKPELLASIFWSHDPHVDHVADKCVSWC